MVTDVVLLMLLEFYGEEIQETMPSPQSQNLLITIYYQLHIFDQVF